MAVYTVLDQQEIEQLIEPMGIGPLIDFSGAPDGIENTTYFITTDQSALSNKERHSNKRRYVITVFEAMEAKDLGYYVSLTQMLANKGLPVPAPVTDYNGQAIQQIKDKPALIFHHARGKHPSPITPEHCYAIGDALAKMHIATQSTDLFHIGNRHFDWLQAEAEAVSQFLDKSDKSLLQQQIESFAAILEKQPDLPKGIIHNDLFSDNTLFDGDELTGIIDFYNASNSYLLHDLAIVVNHWCSDADGSIDQTRYQALMQSYQTHRPLTDSEWQYWPEFLRINATRFWVSRLSAAQKRVDSPKGTLSCYKNPDEFKVLLQKRINMAPNELRSVVNPEITA